MRHHALADHDVTRGRLFQSRDAAEHRGLAGAGRPEEHEQLPVAHVEIEGVQSLDAAVEDFAQPADCDRRHPLADQGDRNARASA